MWPALRDLLNHARTRAATVPRLRVSDSFPNVLLRTQFDEPVRFRDAVLNPHAALVANAMYTTCRGSCPRTSDTIADLRQRLGPVFGRQIVFVSLTLEPKTDTPARLKEYAARYGADRQDPKRPDWLFLTGAAAEVDALRRALGFFDLDPRVDRDVTRHAAELLFGNPRADRWAALTAELPVAHVAQTVRRVAGTTFEQKYGIRG